MNNEWNQQPEPRSQQGMPGQQDTADRQMEYLQQAPAHSAPYATAPQAGHSPMLYPQMLPVDPAPNQPGAPGDYEFHRLGRASINGKWWRPLLVAAVIFPIGIILLIAFSIITVLTVAVNSDISHINQDVLAKALLSPSSPELFVMLFGTIAIWLPVILFAQLLGGKRQYGHISSVAGYFRWRWFAICALCAFAFNLLPAGANIAMQWGSPTQQGGLVVNGTLGVTLMLLAIFFVIPVQCAAEEYFFRGYLMQTFGQWIKYPVVAILAQVPLFMWAHTYGTWGAILVGVMALCNGWLTYRTGGLEAATALHIANNVTVVISTWALGLAIDMDTEGSPLELLIASIIMLTYTLIIERLSRRLKVQRVFTVAPRAC